MSNVVMVTDSSPTKALIIRSEHNNNPPVSMWKQGDLYYQQLTCTFILTSMSGISSAADI